MLVTKINTIRDLLYLLRTARDVSEIDSLREEIAVLIPEVREMFDYSQDNPYHCYDLWIHSLHVVVNLSKEIDDDMLFLAALLHDIGKPITRCRGRNPEDLSAHYYGHAERGAEIIENCIIPRLIQNENSIDSNEIRRLLYFVKHHDDVLSFKAKSLRKQLKKASIDEYKLLLNLRIADAKSHVLLPEIVNVIETCEKLLDGGADEIMSGFNNRE